MLSGAPKVYKPNRPSKHNVKALEIFAGSSRWSAAMASLGIETEAYDILDGENVDILNGSVHRKLLAQIKQGVFRVVHFGFPCSSWSRARKNDGRGPPPLRDDGEYLFGLPNLTQKDQERVDYANKLLEQTLILLEAAIKQGCIVTFENPRNSRVWKVPALEELVQRYSGELAFVDFCQYFEPWKKSTTFKVWNLEGLGDVFKRCAQKGKLCSCSGREHVQLIGKDPITKKFRTKIAEPYPQQMCNDIASYVVQALHKNNNKNERHSWPKPKQRQRAVPACPAVIRVLPLQLPMPPKKAEASAAEDAQLAEQDAAATKEGRCAAGQACIDAGLGHNIRPGLGSCRGGPAVACIRSCRWPASC